MAAMGGGVAVGATVTVGGDVLGGVLLGCCTGRVVGSLAGGRAVAADTLAEATRFDSSTPATMAPDAITVARMQKTTINAVLSGQPLPRDFISGSYMGSKGVLHSVTGVRSSPRQFSASALL